jgi:hypothetical protein
MVFDVEVVVAPPRLSNIGFTASARGNPLILPPCLHLSYPTDRHAIEYITCASREIISEWQGPKSVRIFS